MGSCRLKRLSFIRGSEEWKEIADVEENEDSQENRVLRVFQDPKENHFFRLVD